MQLLYPLAALGALAVAQDSGAVLQGVQSCCDALKKVLPKSVFSDTDLTLKYQSSTQSYYTQQERAVHPSCVVIPASANEVSTSVKLLGLANRYANVAGCKFAVRSGGHTPFATSANIEGGVTIDLSSLNQVTVHSAKTSVDVGPGNRWGNVYSQLDKLGIATSGGRVSEVGVGGLITGGGISFFSPRYGMVCDNVLNFEVVLASGDIVNANATSNPDLYRALKGGSNNFGIVTKFTMRTFQQGPFWGGFAYHSADDITRSKLFNYFENFTNSATYDPYAALIHSVTLTPAKIWLSVSDVEYTKPEPYPPVFKDFFFPDDLNPITGLLGTSLVNTMRISNLTDFTTELTTVNPPGERVFFATMTIKNNAEFMETFFQLADSIFKPLLALSLTQFSISYQSQPQTIIKHQYDTSRDGNSLGLGAQDGDLINILAGAAWISALDDKVLKAAVKTLITQATAAAKKAGVWHEYLYLNYADDWQKPITGYGADVKAFLQKVSRKYDPNQLFQIGVPGGFKLATA